MRVFLRLEPLYYPPKRVDDCRLRSYASTVAVLLEQPILFGNDADIHLPRLGLLHQVTAVGFHAFPFFLVCLTGFLESDSTVSGMCRDDRRLVRR